MKIDLGFEYIPPTNPEITELKKSEVNTGHRYICMNQKPNKINDQRVCVWCNKGKLKHHNQKYCSEQCRLKGVLLGSVRK